MDPRTIVEAARGRAFEDEDGNEYTLTLLPPLNERDLQALEDRLPCPLPEEARALLTLTRGFEECALESVDFSGLEGGGFGMEEAFPSAVPIAHDGYGNYWVVDLTTTSESFGPIFFACHDPPVIVFQTSSLAHFIEELFRFDTPPHECELNRVHEEACDRIWRDNPGMLTVEACRASGDAVLAAFAQTLDESYLIADLRRATMGDGFSWGRYGGDTVVRRHGEERVFAYQVKRSFLARLFGW